ncbi:MAG: hypothetical protein ACOCRK_07810 [bacterium]
MVHKVKLYENGSVFLPKFIRDEKNLRKGDYVFWAIKHGKVMLLTEKEYYEECYDVKNTEVFDLPIIYLPFKNFNNDIPTEKLIHITRHEAERIAEDSIIRNTKYTYHFKLLDSNGEERIFDYKTCELLDIDATMYIPKDFVFKYLGKWDDGRIYNKIIYQPEKDIKKEIEVNNYEHSTE